MVVLWLLALPSSVHQCLHLWAPPARRLTRKLTSGGGGVGVGVGGNGAYPTLLLFFCLLTLGFILFYFVFLFGRFLFITVELFYLFYYMYYFLVNPIFTKQV